MTLALFDRTVEVTLARPVAGEFNEFNPNARIIRDLRVSFAVTRTLKPDPNVGNVTIYNLSEASRAAVQVRPLNLKLLAGYGDDPAQIYQGDLHWSRSYIEGPDWITVIELGDGLRSFTAARIKKSFGASANSKDVLVELAASMGLTMPGNVANAQALRGALGGVSMSGPSSREMTRVAGAAGYDWSVQDGVLQLLEFGGVTTGAAVDVSRETGMIGTPELSAPDEENGKPKLSVKTLINSQVRPGGLLRVTSRAVTGSFKIERVVHSGDTHAEAWSTAVEAKLL